VPTTTVAERATTDKKAVVVVVVKNGVYVSYAALQAHGIVIVALHREYSPGIIFIFSQGR
jgi:hypothetical protein